ncbi:MAG: efflux RND transporter periplasmic adaptor subunit [Deltaproteobacteria bacterium]|nr:efflux RND transporter periplasmic adaptor subunit [Deltaproteobacteria bacterium]
MSPAPRRYLLTGLVLGVLLVLATYGVLYLAGYHIMRHEPSAPPPSEKEKAPLCYVSPTNPDYIRFEPGKDPQGQQLVPVYPTQPPSPGAPPPERAIKYWQSPMDPKYIRDKPGKDYMGHDLIPVYGEVGPPTPKPGVPVKERKIKYWVSPMDPGYVRDKPGKAPCGMDLVPVYEEEGEARAVEGTIAVDPNILQSMGVRTAKVERRSLAHTIRAVGKVLYDERQFSVVNTKINGWVERLYVKATGDPIRKGQSLLSIYSPELVATQQEYLLALKNRRNMEKSPFPELKEGAQRLVEAARQRLIYWDIPAAQVAALENTGTISKTLTLASPVNGIITKRMVTEGQYVKAGMPLLEVADLSTVWVEADIYEYELPWVKVGQHAQMTLQYLPGETFHGNIHYIYPYLSGATRTAKVRLAFANPKLRLKPDMFAQVEIASPQAEPAVAVPAEAILDTGEKQHVFVALGQGRFEPREVKVGRFGDDRYREILAGLEPGEEVVTSAQFLLDSESRFREAISLMLEGKEKEGGKPEGPPAAMPEHKH